MPDDPLSSQMSRERPERIIETRWRIELQELLSEVDGSLHRLMQRFLESGTQAKVQIASMIDESLAAGAAERSALEREIAEILSQMDRPREAPAESTPRGPADIQGVLGQVRAATAAELAPIRSTVDQLHSIETTVAALLASDGTAPEVRCLVHFRGVSSYQQAVSLTHSIEDGVRIRALAIVSYQPGRLVLELRGEQAEAMARQVLSTSAVPLLRLRNDEGDLEFQVIG